MACNYARVVVDLPHPSLDKPFDYIIPDELLNKVFVGIRLKVPFGIKNKLIDGYCISISKDTECLPQKLKSIDSVYDDEIVFLEKYLPLVEWMRHEYHCTYIEAIRCFVPPYAKKIKNCNFEVFSYRCVVKIVKI